MTAIERPELVNATPHPWLRFWARTIDALLLGTVWGVVFVIVVPEVLGWPRLLLGPLFCVPWALTEAGMIALWGTTPGKWLLSLRVLNRDGTRLSYFDALVRTFLVLWRGMGLNLPIVGIVTHVIAYRNLMKEDETSWDREGGHVLSHGEINPWRILLLMVLVMGGLLLIISVH